MKLIIFLLSFSISSFAAVNKIPAAMLAGSIPTSKLVGDGLVRTEGTTTGKVGFCSAKISATGVISDHLGGCFASCTNATTPVCTFTSGYWKSGSTPNCWISISPSAGYAPSDVQVTTTTMQGLMVNTAWGAQSGARTYFCHGQTK